MNKMKTKIKLTLLAASLALMTGCMTKGGFANLVKEAGTADKEIKLNWTGMGGQLSYESKPLSSSDE